MSDDTVREEARAKYLRILLGLHPDAVLLGRMEELAREDPNLLSEIQKQRAEVEQEERERGAKRKWWQW